MYRLVYLICVFNFFNGIFTTKSNSSTKRTIEEDYYLNYDYDVVNNNTFNIEFRSDSLILPNPESLDSKYTIDVLPNVELPDDSLADSDLRDHDFIDNIMYVYYGSQNRNVNNYGTEIIIIGSVLSCAAQLLTICFVFLKKNEKGRREMRQIFFHLMCSFCLANLLFMLGVYATKSVIKCLVMSLVLHYLHLLTAIWMFLYCYYINRRFSSSNFVRIKYFTLIAYGTPLLFSLVSYMITPHSYETKRFCFISVQKGMILNYMLPVSMLIILTTIYSLNGIRKINLELSKLELTSSAESLNALKHEIDLINEKKIDYDENEVVSLRESKTCLKLLCIVQTGYDIVWFIVVLALENVCHSNSMAIIYAITSCILNWYIFIKTKSFLPSIIVHSSHIIEDLKNDVKFNTHHEKNSPSTMELLRQGSSDSIPLLNSDSCPELRELRHDYISTISS